MNAQDKETYNYYHPNEKNSAPTETRLEPVVSHESPTEQQNDLGRRPWWGRSPLGRPVLQNPFNRQIEPGKFWLYWIVLALFVLGIIVYIVVKFA